MGVVSCTSPQCTVRGTNYGNNITGRKLLDAIYQKQRCCGMGLWNEVAYASVARVAICNTKERTVVADALPSSGEIVWYDCGGFFTSDAWVFVIFWYKNNKQF